MIEISLEEKIGILYVQAIPRSQSSLNSNASSCQVEQAYGLACVRASIVTIDVIIVASGYACVEPRTTLI